MKTTKRSTSNKPPAIVVAVLVAAVIAALIVALSVGRDPELVSGPTAQGSRIPADTDVHASFAEVVGEPLPRFEPGAPDSAIGMVAPSFTASYYDDTEAIVDLADGNPRIILFLAHW